MLILRGKRGPRPDESGKTYNYEEGALHERPAMEYARRKGYVGFVLKVAGDPTGSHSPQTTQALELFLREDSNITAFYGFSGGGFNIYWVLQALKEKKNVEALKRIDLVVVIGAPNKNGTSRKAQYKPSAYL